jgi:cation diffusion facilitator CzcD-associated flavoprotein CzcO
MAVDENKRDGEGPLPSYSQFACIGTGFSAIGLGATLKRWYGIDDVRFFERHSQLGGTWFVNQYPGNHTRVNPHFPQYLGTP